ncbi:MAG TPA: ribose-phosphate pyrophosphokinase [Alphaproteobacteria bacterium]|nr:ribose-phosphate pyrophosphokinase [Alphaproteobacteria bacterium]
MAAPLLVDLHGHAGLARDLAAALGAEPGRIEQRRFPDGESYVRFDSPVAGRAVLLLAALDRPDEKFLPLVFAASTARELGAASVGLIAPYLPYMRQDARFRPGEGVTSAYFARALSAAVDWLVTVDPHLHRRKSLAEIYTVPALALHTAPLLAQWIAGAVDRPMLIGPDVESKQWVAAVARTAGAPSLVLEKTRRGDRDVAVSVPDVERWRAYTPVLVDDIVSTGRTLIETVGHLQRAGLRPPVCVAVHAVFAGNAYEDLKAAGVARVVTTDTLPHETNAIEVAPLLAEGVRAIATSR